MKKVLSIVSIGILLFIGIYAYNQKQINQKEVNSFNIDSLNDYEDIIIKKGNDEDKLVALTFDDGPDEDYTPQILDVLKKYNVKATFFVVGQKVGWHPEVVKREFEEGHEIGNHTFTHINVCHRGYSDILAEINQTQEAIKNVTGKEPKIFRPPYRAINKEMCSIVKDKEMNVILWSNLDPRDWSNPGVGYIANTIITKVTNGNIILLHDYNNQRQSTSQTIQALDVFIPALLEKGYKFVTVSELIDNMDKNYPTQK